MNFTEKINVEDLPKFMRRKPIKGKTKKIVMANGIVCERAGALYIDDGDILFDIGAIEYKLNKVKGKKVKLILEVEDEQPK